MTPDRDTPVPPRPGDVLTYDHWQDRRILVALALGALALLLCVVALALQLHRAPPAPVRVDCPAYPAAPACPTAPPCPAIPSCPACPPPSARSERRR